MPSPSSLTHFHALPSAPEGRLDHGLAPWGKTNIETSGPDKGFFYTHIHITNQSEFFTSTRYLLRV